jgi:membrane associated rhomboid family serine protease
MLPIKSSVEQRHTPGVTIALIVANSLAFLYELSLGREELRAFAREWGLVSSEFWPGC